MNYDEDLYDARVGVETYARYIRQNLKDQETWRDIVRGAADLCIDIQYRPACRENPYLCDLLMTVVGSVLSESEDNFGGSDRIGESALVRSTKKEILKAISEFE